MDRELPQTDRSSGGNILWVVLFTLTALFFAPADAARSESGSLTVTEIVETVEYELIDPAAPALPDMALRQYGPFHVIAPNRVQMVGTVDSDSPAYFRQMLGHFPRIEVIDMVDCNGSIDEHANLRLARMIRDANIRTHVPAHGSVRSGAVELFLAGVQHTADPGAEFVVHSWQDEDGLEAADYPADDPVHAEYLDYYREMGLPADKAAAFYALTNSVPFADQLKLSRQDLVRYQLLH